MNALGLITARGRSKGVPGKNIRPLGGKPLINWTIDAALASGSIDNLVLSTDDEAIAATARDAGCDVPFMRPDELASDTATSVEVIHHALSELHSEHDIVVLLQPTSPLRRAEDISGCIETLLRADAPCAVSVCLATPPPEYVYRISDANRLVPVVDKTATRRQDLPAAVTLNGAVYAFRRDWFLSIGTLDISRAVPYEMPIERSIDIDTELDFRIAESLIGR